MARLKLRNRRKSLSYTQEQVADGVGIARTYYTEIENGNRQASLDVWLRIGAFLDISEGDLVSYMREGLKQGHKKRGA